ncbi:MAG: HlyC/CorC family transporter [Planctomycetes bacterium]|nr:HlyC/CorC family transporter [Planctomycetota bacterium]MBI3834556.1 HlyC/CorC family transporter [Planctomycetota bacterium]
MNTSVLMIGLAALAALTLVSALNLSLRGPIRAGESEEHSAREEILEALAARRHRFLQVTAILRSVSIFVLFGSTLEFMWFHKHLSSSRELWDGCAVSLGMLMVFGVAIPHAWAKYRGEWLLIHCIFLLRVGLVICWPVMLVLDVFDPLVRRLCDVGPQDAQSSADAYEREILDVVSEGEIRGAVDELEKEMIESVIELGDTRVQGIMTPRTDIVALPVDSDLQAVRQSICKHGHSRIPVYDGTIDTILGVLYVKDLLRRGDSDEPFVLRNFMRKALFIPESKPVRDLLRQFQAQKIHIAIVLDEYGGTAGLVSIEDILEELVGELADEYETPEPPAIKTIDESTFDVDGRVRIDEINGQLNIALPESPDYETIGGYVSTSLGRIPKVGEHHNYDGVDIRVVGADSRKITRLRLTISSCEEKRVPAGQAT